MVHTINTFIKQYNMLEGCDKVVVGLSGGADSVCLLLVLHSIIKQENLDVSLMAVHINHGIRGEEAARDQEFSRRLCEKLNIEFVHRCVDIPALAAKEGISEEEAGRKFRYAVFAECAGVDGRIAVAHHMDDQAETLLMNMFRGSGIKGTRGMTPVRDNIIRPLLCVSRQQIEEFLASCGQEYVTDSTNAENIYTRNRIRNELIPYIKEHINEQAVKHIADMAEDMRRTDVYLDEVATHFIREYVSGGRIELQSFVTQPDIIRSRVVLNLIKNMSGSHKDIYRSHVDAVLSLVSRQVGKSVSLPYGLTAVRGYDAIELKRDYETVQTLEYKDWYQEVVLPLEDETVIDVNLPVFDGRGLNLLKSVKLQVCQGPLCEETIKNEKNVYTKFFNYDKINSTFVFRFRHEGDIIMVRRDGMKKRLKKELIDKKVPERMRNSVLMIAVGNEVLWAVGVRRSESLLVDEETKKTLVISLNFQEEI